MKKYVFLILPLIILFFPLKVKANNLENLKEVVDGWMGSYAPTQSLYDELYEYWINNPNYVCIVYTAGSNKVAHFRVTEQASYDNTHISVKAPYKYIMWSNNSIFSNSLVLTPGRNRHSEAERNRQFGAKRKSQCTSVSFR